jgi:RNA methyltransferase, TrmH family
LRSAIPVLIRSSDNPVYRRLKRLADSSRIARSERRTLAEGLHLIEAAAAADHDIFTLLLRATDASPAARGLAGRVAAERGVAVVELAAALYDAISPVQHGAGVLAEIAFAPAPLPAAITDDAIFLDAVQDPGNVGALLRTAAAAGVRHALLGAGCAYAGSPRVMRAAMGAHFALAVHADLTADSVRAAFRGTIVLADAADGDSVFSADWGRAPTLWIFGGEGQGVSAAAAAIADRRVRIPLAAGVESLNVAAAAAVCLFEQRRRRLCGSQ